MSMPQKTWRESAEMISPFNCRAAATPTLVFPDAVGPSITSRLQEVRPPEELFTMDISAVRLLGKKKDLTALSGLLCLSGEPRWDRTNDHLIKSQVLYLLS